MKQVCIGTDRQMVTSVWLFRRTLVGIAPQHTTLCTSPFVPVRCDRYRILGACLLFNFFQPSFTADCRHREPSAGSGNHRSQRAIFSPLRYYSTLSGSSAECDTATKDSPTTKLSAMRKVEGAEKLIVKEQPLPKMEQVTERHETTCPKETKCYKSVKKCLFLGGNRINDYLCTH